MRIAWVILVAVLALSLFGVACNTETISPNRPEYRSDTVSADRDVPLGGPNERLEIYTGTY